MVLDKLKYYTFLTLDMKNIKYKGGEE